MVPRLRGRGRTEEPQYSVVVAAFFRATRSVRARRFWIVKQFFFFEAT